MNDIITPDIREALREGAEDLRRDCEGYSDAIGYTSDLCHDVCADLCLTDFEGDDEKETALRDAAKEAIRKAFGRQATSHRGSNLAGSAPPRGVTIDTPYFPSPRTENEP